MKLRIVVGLFLLASCVAAGAADRKFIVKPRAGDIKGLPFSDVVSLQIFCTDLKLYETFNSVYKTYFHGDYPARSFIGTNQLVRNGKFEVLGVAVKRAQ
jgi:enamine deaminase RidA (YjgF/YER057c/UK114 family)